MCFKLLPDSSPSFFVSPARISYNWWKFVRQSYNAVQTRFCRLTQTCVVHSKGFKKIRTCIRGSKTEYYLYTYIYYIKGQQTTKEPPLLVHSHHFSTVKRKISLNSFKRLLKAYIHKQSILLFGNDSRSTV